MESRMESVLILITACLLGTSFAYHGQHPGGVVSKRDAAGNGADNIYQLVKETLDKAREGITAANLSVAASQVQAAADAFLDANGGEVPAQEIQDVIKEVAATFHGATAVSALFDDPVTYEGYVLDGALCLWNGLVDKARELEAAGNSPNPAIAAISLTAQAIQSIVSNTVAIVTYVHDHSQSNPSKRWEVNGGYKYGPGGPSYNVGFSHSWRRRSAMTKRRWNVGANVGYSRGGGLNVGASLSYSWRK